MKRRALLISFMAMLALVLTACGTPEQTGGDTMNGMDHGSGHATSQTQAPYDAQFIDGMIAHHEGAVAMAQQALTESERPEIRQLSENIIATQNQEVEQMRGWRAQWYADLAPTGGTGGHMGDMALASDPSIPFDQRFITAMISHHEGAIAMAKEAQTKAEHQEIKQLAGAIITAQEAEVQQLQAWQQAWFQ